MAKKTRTELSTLALNTNLPDNTTEQITPTTERSQLTDERESVVNYKDDLGGATNAGKFLTVATDGESLTMVDEPSSVPDWVTFLTGFINEMILNAGDPGSGPETLSRLKFKSFDGTKSAQITFTKTDNALSIATSLITILITDKIDFTIGTNNRLRIESDELTNWGSIMSLNAPQFFDASPLYTLKFKGIAANPVAGVYTYEEFANIKGGKENATENDKAGYLSFTTGIADGTLTERLHISSGGITTLTNSSTSNTLVLNGTSGYSYLRTQQSGVDKWAIGNITSVSDNLEFHNGTTKLTILSGGTVLFGTTGIPNGTSIYGSAFEKSTLNRLILKLAVNSTNNSQVAAFYNPNGNVGGIQTNGSATLFVTSSDYRLKENVTPITDALSRLNQLKPSRFNFIADADKIVDGFIAHEVQDIIPEAISGEKDALNEDGTPDYQGIDQSKIVPLLTAAIQEQQTIIEDLKARIEKLEL